MTTSPPFFAVELDAYQPGSNTIPIAFGWGTTPWGALAFAAGTTGSDTSATITASDVGYRTRASDPNGVVVYPPVLQNAFAIDRRMNLDPGAAAVAAAWGSVDLYNTAGQFDAIAATWNSDGRGVRIYYGAKSLDTARGIFLDPSYSALTLAFSGVATPWFLSETALTVPLRDASYWLERPYQTTQYLGTGTYEGPSTLASTTKPRARGGSSSFPIRNVSPTLIDATNRIYQYTDGPGTVVNLWEGGVATITFNADTTNLYAGSTPSGQYRTDNSRGLFQLGATPVGQITCDVTGAFPTAGAKTNAVDIARYMLTEDLQLPAGNINTSSFTAGATSFPYVAGVWWPAGDTSDGATAVGQVLAGLAASLVPTRTGALKFMALRAISPTSSAVASWDTSAIVSLIPQPLPATLDPPPYRWRVAYSHNYTVQTRSQLLSSATDARAQALAMSDSFAAWSSNAVLTAYRRPNDSTPVGGSLMTQANASTVATALGALWGVRRRLYAVTVPVAVGLGRELGDIVSLDYPTENLPGGRVGQIVSEQFRSGDATITYGVLV